jgi:hypothetical protein
MADQIFDLWSEVRSVIYVGVCNILVHHVMPRGYPQHVEKLLYECLTMHSNNGASGPIVAQQWPSVMQTAYPPPQENRDG